MNRYTTLAFLSFTLLNTSLSFAETVFVEQNGRLVVEVESTPAVSNWHQTTAFPNYRGVAAYEWTGAGTTGARNADAGALTFHFTINTPGNYEFRWRSRIGEGTNGTEANDSWVRFPTGSNITGEHPLNGWTKGYMNQINAWSWRTVTVDHVGESIRQYFAAGDHTLQISGRSKGHVLDRFTLFKYDSVNFHDDTFTNAPQSPYTGDEIEVITLPPENELETEAETETETTAETEAEVQPEQQPDSNPTTENTNSVSPVVQATQPWQTSATQQEANECRDGIISLPPEIDVYTYEEEIISDGDLHTDGAGQRALLRFDLSGVPATVVTASLAFTVGADSGQGEITLSAGSHDAWNESNSSQLPDISHLIGSFNGSWSTETRYELPFEYTLLGNEKATLLMEMNQGADGISVIASGADEEPRLQLTGPQSFCSEYEANLENLATPDSNPDSEPEAKVEAESVDASDTGGGGSFSLPGILLLTLVIAAFRK